MRTNKEGKAFLAFGVSVVIPAKSGINKTFEISVAKDGGMDELNGLSSGTRVELVGVLTFHKKDDTFFLNMSATGVNTFNAPAEDSVKGTIEFRGTVGNKIEEKKDKKDKPYLVFSAFSSEKVGEGYSFTWVRFMHFGQGKPEWMEGKCGIDAKGELQLSIYNDRLDITCRVAELTQWEKQPYQGGGTNPQ
jgi:hypothetical protein